MTRHKKERDKRVFDRIKAILAFDDGYTPAEISKILLLNDATIRRHIDDHFNNKLGPWEVEDKRNSGEHHLLQHHREADDDTNHDSKHATGAHQDKGFIKIQNLDAAFGEAHGSHNSYFFCLVHQVGAHAGTKRKEAQEHRDCYNNVEDYVQDVFDLVVCFVILKVVYDLDGVQDFR